MFKNIKFGDKGYYVALLQKRLLELGYYHIAIRQDEENVLFDIQTSIALRNYQIASGVACDLGVVNDETWRALGFKE